MYFLKCCSVCISENVPVHLFLKMLQFIFYNVAVYVFLTMLQFIFYNVAEHFCNVTKNKWHLNCTFGWQTDIKELFIYYVILVSLMRPCYLCTFISGQNSGSCRKFIKLFCNYFKNKGFVSIGAIYNIVDKWPTWRKLLNELLHQLFMCKFPCPQQCPSPNWPVPLNNIIRGRRFLAVPSGPMYPTASENAKSRQKITRHRQHTRNTIIGLPKSKLR